AGPHAAGTWIVGGEPGAATARIAQRFGARPIDAAAGTYVVATARARPFANALGEAGRLRLAEHDALAVKRAFPSDPLTPFQYWIAPVLGDPGLTPPPVTPRSPRLGIVEEQIDLTHPDMQGIASTSTGLPPDDHGTAVAAVAGAPANGVGTVGIWPGMRILLPVYRGVSCSNITGSLARAVAARVSVVNMSYGFQNNSCFVHFVTTQKAFSRGVVLVAAAGNEFAGGNPPERPAVDPHVITVAALKADSTSADFSNENGAIDVSAPGVGVLTAVPPVFDSEDGSRDGFEALDGTSFSSPMVAAAATWLRAVCPRLRAGQVQHIFQASADDLGEEGWDKTYGYGRVNLRDALTARTPGIDPGEPNEDVEWVDGRRLGRRYPLVFAGRPVAFGAGLDQFEDPYDVYRARIPARSTVVFSMAVGFGDPDLDVYSGSVRTILSDRGLLGRSRRSGRATDTVVIRNRNRSPRSVYVNPYILDENAPLDARYRLSIRRIGPA
ncbi:MAG: S8 family peptidase, partial [Solirubrobacteraceae bacterium]